MNNTINRHTHAKATLVDDNGVDRFEGITGAKHAVDSVLQHAQRHIFVLTHSLDSELFHDGQAQELSRVARRHQQTWIKILIRDSSPLHGQQNPIIDLSQRLLTKIHIRTLTEPWPEPHIGFVCADTEKLTYFNDESSYNGFINLNARAESRTLLNTFNMHWNLYSQEDPNFKHLMI